MDELESYIQWMREIMALVSAHVNAEPRGYSAPELTLVMGRVVEKDDIRAILSALEQHKKIAYRGGRYYPNLH